jgi:gluconokinase
MGVSGVGKTTVGSALATKLGIPFIDADDLHPAANKAKMAASIPLTDEDRWPWLETVARAAGRRPSAVACSALRRRYRDYLLSLLLGALFLHREADRQQIDERVSGRTHEYMPARLLDSQLATLEPLAADEPGFQLDATLPVENLLKQATERLVPTDA